jgi:alpha-soluble NSF attachment protein
MSALSKAQRTKGDVFYQEAESTLKKSTWLASSTEQKYENAAESFVKAATAYKVGGCSDEAGAAYRRAADLYKDKLKSLGEASKCLSDAGACLKKSNPAEAVGCYRSAVTLLCDAGRLNQAAKLSKEIAEIFENDGASADEGEDGGTAIAAAIASYQQAAELFEMEQAKSQASSCLQKVAELSSGALDPPELLRAAEIYEGLGRQCLDSNLLKYNAKTHFLNGILCHLANGDSIGASQALARFDSLDYTFADSREGKFARQLVECVEGFDPEGFATACFEYDRISKLDPWKTSLLVKVKRSIEDSTGGGGGVEDDIDLT